MLNKLELDILCARLMLQVLSPVSFLLVVFLLEKIGNEHWQLRKRRMIRWFQYFDWKNDLPSFRWLILLFVVGISVVLVDALFCWVSDCSYIGFNFAATKKLLLNATSETKTPAAATLLLALYSAPAAYVIWWFRDANNRQQIENQRKDVNLKDFHRLAEWAAGMHLPEDKIVESQKRISNLETKNIVSSNELKTSNTTETNRSVESFIAPNNHILHTPSRRDGAASLQVAAIYQLQAFLQGDYGKQFQRPAFQLLKSIWLVLVTSHLEELDALMQQPWEFTQSEETKKFREAISSWRIKLHSTLGTPIGQAINIAIGTQQGWVLRQHAIDLPNAIFTGYNSRLDALQQLLGFDTLQQPLELDGLRLLDIQLQGASLHGANFQKTDLMHANLQGAMLGGGKLQDANLFGANLQGINLNDANLKGANLSFAKLQGAYLKSADMQEVDLYSSDMRGIDLFMANLKMSRMVKTNLQGADLLKANLQGAIILNVEVDNTDFRCAETDDTTQVFKTMNPGNPQNKNYIFFEKETFIWREKLRDENGLILPDILYKQLFAKPTEYTVLNNKGEKETKFGVGLREEF